MSELTLNRRRFLQLGATGMGALLGAAACKPAATVASSSASAQPVGLQLYTLRSMMEKSVAETLALVAEVGYKEVELAGLFGNTPQQFADLLKSNGLTSPSTHIMPHLLRADLSAHLDAAEALGHKYIVVPYLMPDDRKSIEDYYSLIDEMNMWGEQCKQRGIQLAYHNHDFEFQELDGELPYDLILDRCDSELLVMELDLYWTVKAGFDPVALFKRQPGRFKMWHVKDLAEDGSFADVGKGTIDFATIFANGELAGIEHKFVERDQTDDLVRTISQGFSAVTTLQSK
ncbi:sugar phosphate isomerase/epimerase family protein [Alteromonas sp. AMM-1]|uniref:sugar phosphate isomerase/epimerase family protein n=1 Tax=Alteromonas sp. AMM-1 TaxID=3394233 RepID=UPI0039A61D48